MEQIGAKLFVATPPFYCPYILQSEMLRHFEMIVNATNVDVCIYNMSANTGANMQPGIIKELAKKRMPCY